MKIKNVYAAIHRSAMYSTLLLCCVAFLVAGCGSSKPSYDDGHFRGVKSVYEGTVVNVGKTTVTEDPSLLGPIVGGVTGGVIGSLVAGPTGTIVGATGGTIYGGGSDTSTKRFAATELTIELENGAIMLIVLGNDDYFLRGDPVRIITVGKNLVRVQHK